ncbi:MAG: hypothetical protein ACJATT_005400 [Myxococcota bacterium]|jgi:hypothetical protein
MLPPPRCARAVGHYQRCLLRRERHPHDIGLWPANPEDQIVALTVDANKGPNCWVPRTAHLQSRRAIRHLIRVVEGPDTDTGPDTDAGSDTVHAEIHRGRKG